MIMLKRRKWCANGIVYTVLCIQQMLLLEQYYKNLIFFHLKHVEKCKMPSIHTRRKKKSHLKNFNAQLTTRTQNIRQQQFTKNH